MRVGLPLLPVLGLICFAIGIGLTFGGPGLLVLGAVLVAADFIFTITL